MSEGMSPRGARQAEEVGMGANYAGGRRRDHSAPAHDVRLNRPPATMAGMDVLVRRRPERDDGARGCGSPAFTALEAGAVFRAQAR